MARMYLGLPAGKASEVFGAVVDDLRIDPGLRSARAVWRLPEEGTAFDDPPATDALTIKLTPKVSGSNRIAVLGWGRTLSEVTLEIAVEITTPGASPPWSYIADTWAAIERRLVRRGEQFAAKRAADDWFTSMGIFDVECPTPSDWGQTGTVTVTFHQET